ncbi:hypothetical protein DIE18_12600 [Burkholderia sp. Bp9125]|nr:hypothetical protein DIE18_12600 [Burkholderia sp. Bp9125]
MTEHIVSPKMGLGQIRQPADSHEVKIVTTVSVTKDQLDAYHALPPDVRAKLGAPVFGMVLSGDELRKIGQVESTVMCPW